MSVRDTAITKVDNYTRAENRIFVIRTENTMKADPNAVKPSWVQAESDLQNLRLSAEAFGAELHDRVRAEGVSDLVLTERAQPQGQWALQLQGWDKDGLMTWVNTGAGMKKSCHPSFFFFQPACRMTYDIQSVYERYLERHHRTKPRPQYGSRQMAIWREE